MRINSDGERVFYVLFSKYKYLKNNLKIIIHKTFIINSRDLGWNLYYYYFILCICYRIKISALKRMEKREKNKG